MKNIDKNLKKELNKSINELLDKIEIVSEDLEVYITSNFENKTIDEEDSLVKLYRALGGVNCVIDYSKELCEIVNNDEE